jgi:urease accessory protein
MRFDPDGNGSPYPGLAGHGGRPGWEAELHLGFSRRQEKTVLAERRHRGPLAVQRPFYPDDGVCHVYLLHPPGGMVAGDRLEIEAALAEGAEALLTTPAAGKCYRSEARTAEQSVRLRVGDRAALEWLPQETIVYRGARLRSRMRIDLEAAARFIGWDMLAFGRPSAGEVFSDGYVEAEWRLFKAGRPFHTERVLLDAEAVQANWGLQGYSSCGTLFAAPASRGTLDIVRALIGEAPGRGATLIDEVLVCRAVDARADRLRGFFQAVWAALRPEVLQRAEVPPRIWAY